MDVGITLRNMGPQSTAANLLAGAQRAESAGLESVWITDHIAIPPDDAEGSEGRYLDPLVTLGFLASATREIRLGTGVLILPYRPPLPTAKQVATLQELSGERLLLGVGIGWMDPEFRALGIDRHERGARSDATLEYLHRCFAGEVMEANGQPFLFRPQPTRPPVLVGGAAPHALARAARLGDGWLPMGLAPDALAAPMAEYRALCTAAGRPPGTVSVMRGLPLADPPAARALLQAYADAGVARVVCGVRYDTADEYAAQVDALAAIVS